MKNDVRPDVGSLIVFNSTHRYGANIFLTQQLVSFYLDMLSIMMIVGWYKADESNWGVIVLSNCEVIESFHCQSIDDFFCNFSVVSDINHCLG